MTAAESRERARLRSERWRREHGIGPRRPAHSKSNKLLDLSRAEAFVADLQAELAEVARCQAVTAAIIEELRP